MSRPLAGVDTVAPPAPAGVVVRTFEPGRDEQAWLDVNGAAFADHPEQGRWTRADLDERMAEPWFDPAGFFLAVDESTGDLLGFHWTKLHEPEAGSPDPVAEVYVIGMAPAAQGRGLGQCLLSTGLAHLAATPAKNVILYVEADNPATHLYERAGFRESRRDVQFAKVPPPTA